MNDKLMTPNQTAIVEVKTEIELQKERFDKYPQSGRVIDSYLIYLSLNYDLLKCTPNSLVKCLLEAVILKLDFTKAKGQLCIVAYKNKDTGISQAELMVEYRGFVDVILRNNKDIAYVDGKAVYKGDTISIDSDKITHKGCPLDEPRGKMIGAYAKAVYKAGGERNVVLYSDDIEKIRGCAKQDYVWKKWPDQMAIKSAVRRLCKLFPMSEDLSNVIESLDQQTELGKAESPLPLDQAMSVKMQEAGLEPETASNTHDSIDTPDTTSEVEIVNPEATEPTTEGNEFDCSPGALESEQRQKETQTTMKLGGNDD